MYYIGLLVVTNFYFTCWIKIKTYIVTKSIAGGGQVLYPAFKMCWVSLSFPPCSMHNSAAVSIEVTHSNCEVNVDKEIEEALLICIAKLFRLGIAALPAMWVVKLMSAKLSQVFFVLLQEIYFNDDIVNSIEK